MTQIQVGRYVLVDSIFDLPVIKNIENVGLHAFCTVGIEP